eukprot:105459_1
MLSIRPTTRSRRNRNEKKIQYTNIDEIIDIIEDVLMEHPYDRTITRKWCCQWKQGNPEWTWEPFENIQHLDIFQRYEDGTLSKNKAHQIVIESYTEEEYTELLHKSGWEQPTGRKCGYYTNCDRSTILDDMPKKAATDEDYYPSEYSDKELTATIPNRTKVCNRFSKIKEPPKPPPPTENYSSAVSDDETVSHLEANSPVITSLSNNSNCNQSTSNLDPVQEIQAGRRPIFHTNNNITLIPHLTNIINDNNHNHTT